MPRTLPAALFSFAVLTAAGEARARAHELHAHEPAVVHAHTHTHMHGGTMHARPRAHRRPVPPCLEPAVTVRRENGGASWTGPLADCHGRPTIPALAALSLLASPQRLATLDGLDALERDVRRIAPAAGWSLSETVAADPDAPRAVCPRGQEPVAPVAQVAVQLHDTHHRHHHSHVHPPAVQCRAIDVVRDVATHDAVVTAEGGVRVLHPRLVAMVSQLARRFPGRAIEMVSGYRPSRDAHSGSRHAHARAMDFRFEGVSRETLRDEARTLADAGVGYYPHSVFIHLDVRDASEGSARWTDYAGPGERARYGTWPPRDRDVVREVTHVADEAEARLAAIRAQEDAADARENEHESERREQRATESATP